MTKIDIRLDSDKGNPVERMNKRRKTLENALGVDLTGVSLPTFDVDSVSRKNCENLIGKIEIPLGIAGPLNIRGDWAKGTFYIPLATTEGALVASINRGCKAISESGGANVYIDHFGITRAPIFVTSGVKESRKLVSWVTSHLKVISREVTKLDSHAKVLSVVPQMMGKCVFIRFTFDTGDAMGMNMATIATEAIAKFIEYETGFECVSVSGNYCVDKKPAWINKIEKRGYGLHADCIVSKAIVERVLKTDSDKVESVFNKKIMLGSSLSGSIGFNAHHANIVAAIFLATGQDPAHVVEGSLGTTYVEALKNGDLYIAVSMPSLPLGTVGGGTGLTSQKEALSIMSVAGGGNPVGSNAKKLSEIVASATLAGELSLLSAFASKDLVRAHKKLGRGENV